MRCHRLVPMPPDHRPRLDRLEPPQARSRKSVPVRPQPRNPGSSGLSCVIRSDDCTAPPHWPARSPAGCPGTATPSPSSTRPSIRIRSPVAPQHVGESCFSKMSNPACCGINPICTYGPAVCEGGLRPDSPASSSRSIPLQLVLEQRSTGSPAARCRTGTPTCRAGSMR